MKNMIVSDIDGTIIPREVTDDVLSNYTVSVFKDAMKDNVIVLATGRIFSNAIKLINKYNIGDYLIGLNGAFVYNIKKKKYLYKNKFPKKIAKKIVDIANIKSEKLYLCTLNNWNFYTNVEEYKNSLFPEEKLLNNPYDIINKEDIYKFEIYYNTDDKVKEFLELIKYNKINISYNIIQRLNNKGYFIEVAYKDVDKYYGVKILSKKLKIRNENIIAFGDNSNDCTMVKGVGTGIAVSNAVEEVRNAATIVIGDVYSDSVAKYIEEMNKKI
ncbi:MAG TPA: Cof-type HAD-IIB family hydrolase [Bacilli bacterium]|nr:Cof-type HAD-IIB family hydrolase [Bacilli bacterium]